MILLKSAGPVLNGSEQLELARRAKAGDDQAVDMLVRHNLLLVNAIIHEVLGKPDVNYADDLLSSGACGIIRAIKRFNPDSGFQFMTYARPWIIHYARREMKRQRELIHLPNDVHKRRLASHRAAAERARKVSSLTETINDIPHDENPALAHHDSPADHCMTSLDMPHLLAAVEQLPERIRIVITKRYGLDGSKPLTLEEVTTYIPVSRERIRQLQKEGLAMLRDVLEEM